MPTAPYPSRRAPVHLLLRSIHRFAALMATVVLATAMFRAEAMSQIAATPAAAPETRPNVIVIITDDQGYGDLSAHGHPDLQTPNLDRLAGESFRLDDFHVEPSCSPTRAAALTGRHPLRNGVWHTIWSRSIPRNREVLMPRLFQEAGYRTGMFGKWHMGESYPHRPHDVGFDEAVYHGNGFIGSMSDFPGNDYFDDTYWRNGQPETFEGYCEEVWFSEAAAFIERNRDEPFFIWLATNNPHFPHIAPERFESLYDRRQGFFGQISSLDHQVGQFMAFLEANGLKENTIVIFMGDNGTASGQQLTTSGLPGPQQHDGWPISEEHFGAGMRGQKISMYDGGHRVAAFVRWPAAGWKGGRRFGELTCHLDILPTLAEACQLQPPLGLPWDGHSLVPLFEDEANKWADRALFIATHRKALPPKWDRLAILTERWRLINGTELYDIKTDPAQRHDVAHEYPEVVDTLRAQYEAFWAEVEPELPLQANMLLGHPEANPTELTYHDTFEKAWQVNVTAAGRYRITFRGARYPAEQPLGAVQAELHLAGQSIAQSAIHPQAVSVAFELDLPEGRTTLQATVTDSEGNRSVPSAVQVERLSETAPAKTTRSENPLPNILYILADDMGISDIQALNPNGRIPTPHMDRLVAEGRVFTNTHTPSSVCTPTRYAIMTGRYAWRTRLKKHVLWGPNDLPLIEQGRLTVAQLLQNAGYATFCVGKWHLGMYWPEGIWSEPGLGGPIDHGFHQYFGILNSLNLTPHAFVRDRRFTDLPLADDISGPGMATGLGHPRFDGYEVLPKTIDEAVSIVRSRRDKPDPFFLFLPLTSPHAPILPTKPFQGRTGLNDWADFVHMTDHEIGRVLNAIDETGLSDNTLIILTSDNGITPKADFATLMQNGHDPTLGMRGCKFYLYEGGHRVPFVMRWPARIEAGTQSDALVCVTDLMRTLAQLTGQKLPQDAGEDSFSMYNHMVGEPAESPREFVILQSFKGYFGIRERRWKLILSTLDGGHRIPGLYPPIRDYPASYETFQLYDLESDPEEFHNLYSQKPEVVARLTGLVDQAVRNGRVFPGLAQLNHDGQIWWPQITWREEP